MSAEEKYNKDARWVLTELKKEELANANSEYKIIFFITQKSDNEPSERSQQRVLKMLVDRKALILFPFYHRMPAFNIMLEIQGATPIGYRIEICQPQFNTIYEEILQQKAPSVSTQTQKKLDLPIQSNAVEQYTITITKTRRVLLNNRFILSHPNFETENHRFIKYVLEHPDETLKKIDIEKYMREPFKKSFHAIVKDLGFRNEIRKVFLEVSSDSVKFRNYVRKSDLPKLDVDTKKLNIEISKLKKN